jgi:hypothetical protein
MNPMTREQRTAVQNTLGFAMAADPDAVVRAVGAIKYADLHRSDPAAVTRAVAGGLSLAKRLLGVEDDYATLRSTVARLVVANNRGDDYNLGDLASGLEQAGIDLKDDYDFADALARATELEGLL